MSVAVSRSDGVTVLTLTSDHSSPCPPLCQLLGALCYSPALCSVRGRLAFQRGGAQAALGALWIITGIMHIGLGTVLINTRSMSVAVSRSDGVTVLSLTSDPSGACPPLCQLLGALCYSPALCSVSRRLPPQRGGPQSALGALWIVTGILHVGLGVVLLRNWGPDMYVLRDTDAPVWLGVLFMLFGGCCVLAERSPRPGVVLLSGVLNLAGAALSITAIAWYCVALGDSDVWSDCDGSYRNYYRSHRDLFALRGRCVEVRELLSGLSSGLLSALLTLSALDLCLGISSAALSIKALKQTMRKSGNCSLC